MGLHAIKESDDIWRRITLDTSENIINVDLAGLIGTPDNVDAVADAIERFARSCRRKPCLLTNWSKVAMTAAGAEEYKRRYATILALTEAVYRYQVTEHITRVFVRTAALSAKVKNSNIFDSKEEALTALRQHRTQLARVPA